MKIHKIGDPHLGKIFRNGVPLHRRGERETMVWAQFERELKAKCDLNVCVGDLFDKMVVPPEVVLRAAELYLKEARQNPKRNYVIMRGNHDASRDADKRSSFDIFAALVTGEHNIFVVRNEAMATHDCLFVPWHPFKTAEEMLPDLSGTFDNVFGHWDVESYGQVNDNLVPVTALYDLLNTGGVIYTGHVHKPQELTLNNTKVVVVGSMQPYAHGEEINDDLYVTITREDLELDGHDFLNKCVRVLLKPGEALPDQPIDCLQLTIKKVKEDGVEEEDDKVELDPFDLKDMYATAMKAEGLDDDFIKETWTKFEGMKDAQAA